MAHEMGNGGMAARRSKATYEGLEGCQEIRPNCEKARFCQRNEDHYTRCVLCEERRPVIEAQTLYNGQMRKPLYPVRHFP